MLIPGALSKRYVFASYTFSNLDTRSKSFAFGKREELHPVYDSLGTVNQISSLYDFRDSLSPMQTEPELTARTARFTLGYIDMAEYELEESPEEEQKDEE